MNYQTNTSELPLLSWGVAEPGGSYDFGKVREYPSAQPQWISVLVDAPGTEEKLFTYRIPPDLSVQPGDILSVPFGPQQIGAIAIKFLDQLPDDLAATQIKNVEEVVVASFFPRSYWQLLERVAAYYYTPLIQVIRTAMPPGLLARSQRRIRLNGEIPPGADIFLSAAGRQILNLLQTAKTGDYTWQYIRRQVPKATSGLKELLKRGWVESYLESPKPPRAQMRQAVTLIGEGLSHDLTPRQQEVVEILRRRGGELWMTELLQICQTSSSLVKVLEEKGYVAISLQERLRVLAEPTQKPDQAKTLTRYQTKALELIKSLHEFALVLLHGVTGSGKTEVYMQAIAPILAQGKSALVLVPEIGLTPQLTDRFRARFGDQIAIYHSQLSDGERYDSWRVMLTGTPQIVIGTRSAIFAPLPNLGLIILDEEFDDSYKQDQPAPSYHARTVAQWRAELVNCPLILGSATPSLESWVQVAEAQETAAIPTYYLSLPERIHGQAMPPIEIVDMREELRQGNRTIFSQSLQKALNDLIETKQQGILFIHRRGHSSFISCRSCGYVMECPHCDVSLAYHHPHENAAELLRCHYCGHTQQPLTRCPECHSPYFKHFGSGTQKVAQHLAQHFPQLRLIRFDSDTTRTKGAHRALISRFAQGEADLLIGTQMLTKGLDLPQVTLVGVVAADGLLNLSDYRASERAFQTLTQVAGRAGRGRDPGRVIIQTYTPDHPVISAVRSHDLDGFIANELAERAALNYPPYGRLILLRISGGNEGEVAATAERLATILRNGKSLTEGKPLTPTLVNRGEPIEPTADDLFTDDLFTNDFELLGPAPAPIMRIGDRYRWQILLKFAPGIPVDLPPLEQLRSHCPKWVSLSIDVDPLYLS
ncbi:primosomal protein N' [Planktothricoides raciborskii]|uniref:Replication restart protein PriA n=1 Tax=Planktothricoides raciborskii FACHB-1370 TaxID=2949576 RepID=A0ABR8EBT9_9CYAN|nr:primosomal protein N' [Planktothricoides raciborskii]MBD2543877.1 primosomal protein N' [Planktothricoides raciborskii FACHB-1370]MBD2583158.1 primosomal protein N' [Planktothricoides raciborskii FACHB-1261]